MSVVCYSCRTALSTLTKLILARLTLGRQLSHKSCVRTHLLSLALCLSLARFWGIDAKQWLWQRICSLVWGWCLPSHHRQLTCTEQNCWALRWAKYILSPQPHLRAQQVALFHCSTCDAIATFKLVLQGYHLCSCDSLGAGMMLGSFVCVKLACWLCYKFGCLPAGRWRVQQEAVSFVRLRPNLSIVSWWLTHA